MQTYDKFYVGGAWVAPTGNDTIDVITAPADFEGVKAGLAEASFTPASAEVPLRCMPTTAITSAA